jgi:gas vesicle protein
MSSDNESYRIDNSDDLSFRDSLSKKRVAFGKQRRTLRQEKKDLRKSYKEILNQVNNSADRRKLKDEYQSAIKDVDTRLNNLTDKNKQGIDNDVHSGIDSIQSDTDPLEAAYASQDFYLYAFKVIDDLDGTVSVLTGTVNTETATGLEPAGQPDELWLKVTFDTDGVVTAASVEESSGTTSETEDYRQIASITWDEDAPTIVQGIKGSQSIASCGATHQWGTLYS